jgi:hypothetical protein
MAFLDAAFPLFGQLLKYRTEMSLQFAIQPSTVQPVPLLRRETERTTPLAASCETPISGSELRPRRTKLEIPGRLCDRQPRAEGSAEQVRHCLPFTEGAQYGIESFYPYGVTTRDETRPGGRFWSRSGNRRQAAVTELRRPILHLSTAARHRSGSRLGYPDRAAPAVLLGPNRFRSDRRAGAGQKLVADAVLHGLQVPRGGADPYISAGRADWRKSGHSGSRQLRAAEMTEDEAPDRELRSRRIHQARPTLAADTPLTSKTNTVFDVTYRH